MAGAKANTGKSGEDKADIVEFFDDMAAGRNEKICSNLIVDYEQRVRSNSVLKSLDARANENILDLGCGNARDIIPMLESGARITGIDISQGMINEAQRDLEEAGYPWVSMQVGDATHLPFPDNCFDKVLCSEVIEHIPDADKAVGEMFRVLKRGGRLVISTPNRLSLYGFDRYIVWEKIFRKKWGHPFDQWRSMDQLCSMLERHACQVVKKKSVCYVPGFILTYFLPWKFAQKLLIKFVNIVEPVMARLFPEYGYLLCVTAVKE